MFCRSFRRIFTSYTNAKSLREVDCKPVSTIRDLLSTKNSGLEAKIQGWVRSVRKMKGIIFLDVNDGSSNNNLQVLIHKSCEVPHVSYGSSVKVSGVLQTNERGQLEIEAQNVSIVGQCDVLDGYPFTPKQKHTQDYIRQFLHFRPRTKFGDVLRARHLATRAVHDYFHENGFVQIHAPVLTSNDCEGAGEVFKVIPDSKKLLNEMKKDEKEIDDIFFNKKTYLTVSSQLHLEAMSRAMSKVYAFGTAFRAENSKSRLHLSEFYMIEGEEAFTNSLDDVLSTIENLVKYITKELFRKNFDAVENILKINCEDVNKHLDMVNKVITEPFTVMTYDEAFEIIKKQDGSHKTRSDCNSGFTKEQELLLVDKNYGVPIFVVDWPKKIKPFYMKQADYDNTKVHAVDLLVPNVGELCGGSLREDNYEFLKQKIETENLTSSLEWYLQLRKFGNVPTGGFGMGFERYLQFVLNIGNIKDTIPFPRWPHNLNL